MEKEKEQPKKCFCARCFLPIEEDDRVDIGGQNFHKMCGTCCVCRQIPKSVKMFYGHVFCADCFKTHVMGQCRGEEPRMHSCSWWSQWAPGMKPKEGCCQKEDCKHCGNAEDPGKKYICSRCLQAVDEKVKVDIAGQHFHPQCCRCYFCHCIPTNNLKIYYGQVFCEECFNRHVMNRNRDNPSEFFKTCFEQWQNVQFAEGMRHFMGGNNKEGGNQPFVFCRCSGGSEWGPPPDTRKSATPVNVPSSIPEDESLEDLYFENRTESSDMPESCVTVEPGETVHAPAAEKIEKLTKYLHELPSTIKSGKKWKNFVEFDKISLSSCGWVDLQDEKVEAQFDCPKCLWQYGPIVVPSELLQRSCENVLQ